MFSSHITRSPRIFHRVDALYEDHVYLPGFHKVFYYILASKSIKKSLHTFDK